MKHLDDETLMAEYQKTGATVYYDEIDRRYRPKLAAMIAQRTDWHTAEDIASMTLVSVITKRDCFDPAKGSLGDWLMTIGRNETSHYFQYNSAVKRGGGVTHFPLTTDDKVAPLDDGERERMYRLIWKLSKDDRQLVFDVYYDRIPLRDIAARCGTTYYQIRKQLAAVLSQLRNWAA